MQGQNQETSEKQISRRTFLDYLIGGSVVVTALGAIGTAISYVIPPKHGGTTGSEKVEVANVEQLPVGKAIKTRFRGSVIMVGNTPQGYFALSAICTHLSCLVDWDEASQQLHCPCHGAIFDTKGNVLAGPAPSPLPSYIVTVVKDKIYVGGA